MQLMTEYQGRLYAYVLSLPGDPDQANDVLQEANLVLWPTANGSCGIGSCSTTRCWRCSIPRRKPWTNLLAPIWFEGLHRWTIGYDSGGTPWGLLPC